MKKGYEPVFTDEACGILRYYNYGYGYEGIQYIRMNADGSTESDGEFYPCNVYKLEKGEFSEIGTGWISENYDAEEEYLDYDHFWEGSLMTEAEYKECLNKLIDTSKCIEPTELYTQDEMLEILAKGDIL